MRDSIPTIKRQTGTAPGPSFTRMFPAARGGNRKGNRARLELTLARIDRYSGQLEELEVESIVAFAERVLPRADLWVRASLEQRQRFQRLVGRLGIEPRAL